MLHDDIDRLLKRGFYAPPQPIEPEPFRRLEMYDRIASIHESAHVVWNYIHQEPIHSVEINKQGAGGGEFKALPTSRVELSDGSNPQQRAHENTPIIEALSDSATRAAWVRHLPAFCVSRHAQHRFGAKQQIFDDACAHDDEVISRIIHLATPDAAERRQLHEQVEAEAAEFVRLYWPEIQKLADELYEHGSLNREEIERVLKRSEDDDGLLDGVPFRRRQDGYMRLDVWRR
jgi:hypothetical protein